MATPRCPSRTAGRAPGRTAGIPVLFLTTEGQETLMARAKKAGARGWLVKPVKPDMLLKAVQQLARPV